MIELYIAQVIFRTVLIRFLLSCNLISTFLFPSFVLRIDFGMGIEQTISGKEVAKHNTRQSCWIIVHGEAQPTVCRYPFWPVVVHFLGNVYDVTEFLDGITFQLLSSDAGISPSFPIRFRPSWYWSFRQVQSYTTDSMPQVVVKSYWNMPGKTRRNSCITLILDCDKHS